MPRCLDKGTSHVRSRSPMRLDEVIRMTDDTIMELCTTACQQELRNLWDSMSECKQGEKELARREMLLKYQVPIVERYGFEASSKGVSASTLETWRFFGNEPTDQELVFKAQILIWLINPQIQQCNPGDSVLATVGLLPEFIYLISEWRECDMDLTTLVLRLRRYVEQSQGRASLSTPLCGTHDAITAERIVSVRLPWAVGLEGKVPVVCAVVQGLLSLSEVEQMCEWAEQRGDWEAHQGHMRLKITDAVLAHKLWLRMRHLLPDACDETCIAGLNEHIRFLKYQPGHYFLPHTDGQNISMRFGVARRSLMSAILYLSEPESIDSGGGTRFISPECNNNASTGRCDHHCDKCIDAPVKKGSLLMFAQSLVHAGTEPKTQGKFAMRTDVMYYG